MLSAEGFRRMTRMLMQAADALCAGRLVMTHEGGYSAAYVPYCGLAVLEELSSIPAHIADPWTTMIAGWGGQDLQPHQSAAIDRAAALVSNIR
jgi:acetoin utilization deacetylase AcuC-like enzyme